MMVAGVSCRASSLMAVHHCLPRHVNVLCTAQEPGGNSHFGHAYSLNGQMAVQDGVRAGCDR